MSPYTGIAIGGPADGKYVTMGSNQFIAPTFEGRSVFGFPPPSAYAQFKYRHATFPFPDGSGYAGIWHADEPNGFEKAITALFVQYETASMGLSDFNAKRVKELLEANNRYQQEARDAKAELRTMTDSRDIVMNELQVVTDDHLRLSRELREAQSALKELREDYSEHQERLQSLCARHSAVVGDDLLDWLNERLTELKTWQRKPEVVPFGTQPAPAEMRPPQTTEQIMEQMRLLWGAISDNTRMITELQAKSGS